MEGNYLALLLSNFDLVMFVLALMLVLLNFFIVRDRVPQAEMIFRWMSLFSVGFTSLYAATMHAFFPVMAAFSIGWFTSPFQYEVAMANLAMGVLGVLSFRAHYAFRLATTIAVTVWLWGDALGHLYQMIRYHNFTVGNAGSWFWMDVIVPIILILCIVKLRPQSRLFSTRRF